jgi:hypothetical protein
MASIKKIIILTKIIFCMKRGTLCMSCCGHLNWIEKVLDTLSDNGSRMLAIVAEIVRTSTLVKSLLKGHHLW